MDDVRAVILEALDRLREDDRLAIAYRYFFDLSEPEMVVALGWRGGTASARLSRALRHLRHEFSDLAQAPLSRGTQRQPIARHLATTTHVELEQELRVVGALLPTPLPPVNLSEALIQRLQAVGNVPASGWTGWRMLTAGVLVAIVVVLACLALAFDPTHAATLVKT